MTIPDDPMKAHNEKARSVSQCRPATQTTQIFISLSDNIHLDRSNFAPFRKSFWYGSRRASSG
jgi:hypothetical protein